MLEALPPEWSLNRIQTLLYCCTLAYRIREQSDNHPEVLTRVLQQPQTLDNGQKCLITATFASRALLVRDFIGFLARDTQDFTLVFRGTRSVQEWLSDFRLHQSAYLGGKVHAGFLAMFLSFENDLHRQIEAIVPELAASGATLWITGHSLGGVMAGLAASSLKNRFPALKVRLCDFGSPRYAGLDFAVLQQARLPNHLRVFNTEDLVPCLPTPLGPTGSYTHLGQPLSFTSHRDSLARNHQLSVYLESIEGITLYS